MAQRVHLGRGAWEYDAPMYHDFEQSSPSYENCSVDKWFDTSATKGLRSPVSGGDKENDGTVQEVSSKAGKPATGTRKALGNVTNTIQMVDPVFTKAKVVKNAVATSAKTVQSEQKGNARPAALKKQVLVMEKKVHKNHDQSVETAHRPVTRSQKKQSSLTVPKSPKLLSSLRSGMHRKVIKSSEELELEEIERQRMEIQSKKGKKKHIGKRKDTVLDERPAKRTRNAENKDNSLTREARSFTVGKSVVNTNEANTKASRKRSSRPKLTMPKSPNFATTRRARPPRFKSTEELELEMIAKVKFKAKPLNKRMISKESTDKSVHMQKKAFTVPEPFSFATDKRLKQPSTQRHVVPPKPFVFGDGPVTRSKAKHVITTGTRKKEPQTTVPYIVNPKPQCEEKPVKVVSLAKTEPSKAAQPEPVIRPVTRGSLLKGGAMRVVRKDEDVFDSPVGEISLASEERRIEENIENEEGSCTKIEYKPLSTFDNPLFRP